jgi:hypothetical protein
LKLLTNLCTAAEGQRDSQENGDYPVFYTHSFSINYQREIDTRCLADLRPSFDIHKKNMLLIPGMIGFSTLGGIFRRKNGSWVKPIAQVLVSIFTAFPFHIDSARIDP